MFLLLRLFESLHEQAPLARLSGGLLLICSFLLAHALERTVMMRRALIARFRDPTQG